MTMRKLTLAAICVISTLAVSPSQAQQATELHVTYSKGQFQPSELRAPADKPVTFRVKNLDAKAMEFETGRYEFYDDFNEKARGALTVQ